MPRKRSVKRISVVSGQAAIVVVIDGSVCKFRRIDQPEYQHCRREDVPYLFGGASDVISVSGKSPSQVFRILKNEWSQDRALQFLLILLTQARHRLAKTM